MTDDPGIITDVGYGIFAQAAGGLITITGLYVATGTGATPVSSTDTSLENENTLYGSARKVGVVTYVSVGTISVNAAFSFTGNGIIREIGIFDDNGNLLYRRVLADNHPFSDAFSENITVNIPFEASA